MQAAIVFDKLPVSLLQLNNILHTAKAIADKAAASEPDLDDDEMDEEGRPVYIATA